MRRMLCLIGAVGLAVATAVPAWASTSVADPAPQPPIADGSGIAFTLKPMYDEGGARPLPFYVGYTEANVSTPDPQADGQASWYNLNIVETAAFQPPEQCTPQKNAAATLTGLTDAENYVTQNVEAAVASASAGRQPGFPPLPSVHHACTERFPGFAQSRYPATSQIPVSARDDYLDKPTAAQACRQDPASAQCADYKQYWPAFSSGARAFVRDGSFETTSTPQPSQTSDAVLMGAGDGSFVSVGLARTSSHASLDGATLTVESRSTMDDVCLVVAGTTCTLQIDRLVQYARTVVTPGAKPQVTTSTTVAGVHGSGVARDVTASDLQLDKGVIDLGGYMQLRAVSKAHDCDPADASPGTAVADSGGFLMYGKGSSGGGIMFGGACARARIEAAPPQSPFVLGTRFTPGTPPQTLTLPGGAPVVCPACVRPGAPVAQVVSRLVPRTLIRDALAWRTAPYWASVLGALIVLFGAGYRFRRAPVVQPVTRRVDLLARRFVRG